MASPGNAEPLGDEEVKQVVDNWIKVLKTPTVGGGYIIEDDNSLVVNSKWTADDAAKKERLSFSRSFAVLKSSLGSGSPVVLSSGSVTVDE